MVQDRLKLFGTKNKSGVILNDIGIMIDCEWAKIPSRFPNIILDQYIIMPDHFHAVIQIVEEGKSLFEIIGAFKSITTNEYISGVKNKGWPSFDKHLWQSRYYDHIIRDQGALTAIRLYILNNPLQ